MPELPEVAVFRRYAEETSLEQAVRKAKVIDETVLDGVSARDVELHMQGRPFSEAHRHGAVLFLHIYENGWVAFDFERTGYLKYYRKPIETPGPARMRVDFSSGFHLAYVCRRRGGRVAMTHDPAVFIRERGLGPDALTLTASMLTEEMTDGDRVIKSLLVDQSVVAGLGSVYADEVLYQAKISPDTPVRELAADQVEELAERVRPVLEAAIRADANPKKMPSHYLTHHRRGDGHCPRCDVELRQTAVEKMSTFFCPRCQITSASAHI